MRPRAHVYNRYLRCAKVVDSDSTISLSPPARGAEIQSSVKLCDAWAIYRLSVTCSLDDVQT
jgi:hypothetical protein